MNKSKFLKKSLAAVLAVLLIVAMIPLSAAASAVVTVVTIDGENATLNGDTYSAAISSPSTNPTVKVTLANGEGYVEHDDETGSNDADRDTTADGTWTFTMTDEEFENAAASFRVYDDAETTTPTATYKVTYTIKNGAEDCSVKSVSTPTQYGNTVVDGTTYTITLPYGTSQLDANAIKVVLNDKNASITAVAGGATTFTAASEKGSFTLGQVTDIKTAITFTVAAEDGVHTQDYTIKMQTAGAFKTFSVDGQRKDAKIDTDTQTIEIYLPFGTKTDANSKWQFVPKFETVYASAEITATKTAAAGGGTVTIKSGDKLELKDFATTTASSNITTATTNYTFDLTVKYTGGEEDWHLTFATPAKDPEPVLKGLRVANYAGVIDEEAHTISLTLPASKRAALTAVSLLASNGATVLPVEAAITTPVAMTGSYVDRNLDTSKDKYTLRVTAAGDEDGKDAGTKKVQDYILNIKTAVDTEPAVKEMKLEDPNGVQYTGAITTDGTILFKLPYSITVDGTTTEVEDSAALENWKLFYSLTEGAGSSSNLIAVPSGTKLTSSAADFWPSAFDGKTTDGAAIKVSIDDKTYKDYYIAVEQGKPSTAATLTDIKITTLDGIAGNEFAKIKDDDNAFSITGSKDLSTTLPFSKFADFNGDGANKAYISAVLPAGAKLFYVDSKDSDKLVELGVLSEHATPVAQLPQNTGAGGYLYDGETKTGGKLTPLELVVVSQAGVKTATDKTVALGTTATKDDLPALGRGAYATYTLTVKKAAAKTVAKLDTFNVYDATTKTTIKGVVKQSPPSITLTLPYGYDDVIADKSLVEELYLDWSSSNYETILLEQDTSDTALTETDFEKVTFDAAGNVDEGTGVTAVGGATPSIQETANSENIGCVNVSDEAGTKNVKYPVTVKFEKEKTEAKLNSVTINGVTARPDANNKVAITLPMATEITALKPAFSVSDGAFMSTNGTASGTFNSTNVIASGTQMNFTAPKTVYVYSENAKNMNTYTIEVTTATGFTDVRPSDWFYKYVMDAVSRGIIIGNGDGTFGPHTNVTRAQFATMMARVDGFDKNAEYTNPFSDMQGITGETLKAIAYCADKGYITGDGDTTFRPNDTISRQEMAVIISRVMKLDVENVEIGTRFADDAKIAGWAKNYVYACVNAKMLMGEGDNTFNPLGSTTRAAAATAAVRIDNAK